MLYRFCEEFSNHANGVETERQYARQRTKTNGSHKDNAHNQLWDGSQPVQNGTCQLKHYRVRGSIARSQKCQRHRQGYGNGSTSNAHRKRID